MAGLYQQPRGSPYCLSHHVIHVLDPCLTLAQRWQKSERACQLGEITEFASHVRPVQTLCQWQYLSWHPGNLIF